MNLWVHQREILFIIMNKEKEPKREGEKREGIAFVFSREVDETEKLDAETIARLDKAIELYREGKIKYFFVSGGTFREHMTRPIAEPMEEYLIEKGVSQNDIQKEISSSNTATNILFGYLHILKKFGLEKFRTDEDIPATEEELQEAFRNISAKHDIYWVSSEFHLGRIKKLLEANNLLAEGQQFASPEDFKTPKGLSAKIVELIAETLLTIEPDGKGKITSFLRNKNRK